MSNEANPAKPSLHNRMEPDERQEQIVQVAAAHFVVHGFDGASMSKIAKEAGVTRALVYHYFSGKSALLEAVLQREAVALLQATKPDPVLSPEQNLRRALGAFMRHYSAGAEQVNLLHLQAEGISALLSERVKANHAVQAERILTTLNLTDDALMRSVVSAWLNFATQLAKDQSAHTEVGQDTLVDICVRVLKSAIWPHSIPEEG